jgi:WD40 repeat protein
MAFSKAALALVALAASAKAQTSFLPEPRPKWVMAFSPMLDGNGLVWAPDDTLVYATAADGTIGAFNPENGEIYNTFQPTGDGTVPFSCNGEIDFSSDGNSLIYAVTEGDTW